MGLSFRSKETLIRVCAATRGVIFDPYNSRGILGANCQNWAPAPELGQNRVTILSRLFLGGEADRQARRASRQPPVRGRARNVAADRYQTFDVEYIAR